MASPESKCGMNHICRNKSYLENTLLERRGTRIRAHTLQSGHAIIYGVEPALQSFINPKLLLERKTHTTGITGDIVVHKCRSGET